jgi:hypothetical protein
MNLPPGIVPPRPPMRPQNMLTKAPSQQIKQQDIGAPNNTLYIRNINQKTNLKGILSSLHSDDHCFLVD